MRKTGQIFLTEKFQIINIKGMREKKYARRSWVRGNNKAGMSACARAGEVTGRLVKG